MLARRLLIAGSGGSFTPPGIPAPPSEPGPPSTILDDTYYNAWPSVCRAGNGNLVLTYTKAFTHHADTSGNMNVQISSNDGVSWGSAIQGYYDTVTPWWATPMGMTLGNDDRLLVPLWRDVYNVSGTGEAGLVYSDDHGATWSSWIPLSGHSFSQEAFSSGPVVLLPGGDLLVSIEGTVSGSVANRSVHTLRSSDNGETWGDEVTIRNYATDSRPYYETCLLLLDNGELIAIHRTSGGTGTHYISRSSDQGATTGGWGTPYAAFDGYGQPHTIQLSTGGLIAVTRKNSDASAIAFASADRGLTWDAGTVLDDTMYEMEYGCPVEKLDGDVLVVYGYQPTSSISNSDIKQVVLAPPEPPPPPDDPEGPMYVDGIYGPGVGFDSRNNYQIGGPANREFSMRFIASHSSTPVQIAVNQRWGPSGYSDGDGGEIKCAIQEDDGTGDPDGTDLMSLTWLPGNPGAQEDRNYLDFTGGVPLVAGTTYHLRFTNIAADPTSDWMSINVLYQNDIGAYPAQRQPGFTNDLAVLWRQGGVWKQPSDAGQTDPDAQQDTPVFDLVYANGGHDGQGYFGVIDGSEGEISGTTKMVREKITITGGSKSVNRIGFRVMRTAGSGDLTIGLYTAAGSLLASGTVPSSTFPTVSAPPNRFGLQWGEVSFSPLTLTNGATYYIRASCPAGTTYWTGTIQQHDLAGSGNPDWGARLLVGCTGAGLNGLGGGGEKTTDGTNWVDLYEFAAADAQSYVALV